MSDSDIRRMLLGRWYREGFALDGEMPISHEAIEFAADGSCKYIQTGRAYYPSGKPAPWLGEQSGHWSVSGRILKRIWRANRDFPARSHEGEVLSLTTDALKLREFPFNSFDNYYRTIRTRNVKTNLPNQAMELTPGRRTIEFSDG